MKASSTIAILAAIVLALASSPHVLAQVPPGGMLDRTPAAPRPGDAPPLPDAPKAPDTADGSAPALPGKPIGVPGGNPGGHGPVNPGGAAN